jgi:hypothetical protein
LGNFWGTFGRVSSRLLRVFLSNYVGSHCPVALCFHLVTPLADSP